MSRSGLDYHGIETPTIGTHALDRRNRRPLDTSASAPVLIISTDKNLNRTELGEHNARLIHIIDILLQDVRILQDLPDNVEPLYNLLIDIVSIPVQRLDCTGFELWVASVEGLRPIFTRGFERSSRRAPLTSETEGYRAYVLYPNRPTKRVLVYKQVRKGFFFPRIEILLALGLLLERPPSARAMLKRGTGHVSTNRSSTERINDITGQVFGQRLAGTVHSTVLNWELDIEMREKQCLGDLQVPENLSKNRLQTEVAAPGSTKKHLDVSTYAPQPAARYISRGYSAASHYCLLQMI